MTRKREGVLGRWARGTEDMKSLAFWTTYVVGFLVVFLAFWFGFLVHGKGFIWYVDGLEQQYMFFIQEGQWLRDLIGNIASGTFELPMWSQQIGYGADYIYSVSGTLGNPINLISVFAHPSNADYLLEMTVPLTLFLAGLSFLWYCSYKGYDAHASLVGCFAYIFGGYSIVAYSQIYLLYPLVLMPLAVRGLDRLFDGRGPLGFIVAMALTFFAGVSTGYMLCLILLAYCLVKYFHLPEAKSPLGFLKWFGKIFGCICLGALIAGVLFYPLAINIVTQGRLGLVREYTLLYSISYYTSLIGSFMFVTDVGADCYTGFAPIALVCVALLFSLRENRDGRDSVLKILFVVGTVALCVPLIGRIANGFAYPNNRWVFGYAFLVSLIVTVELPKMLHASDAEKRKALGIIGVYAIACMVCCAIDGAYSPFAGFAGLALAIALCFGCAQHGGLFKAGTLVAVAASCLVVSVSYGTAASATEVGFGRSYNEAVVTDPGSLVASLDDAGPSTRFDVGPGIIARRNGNWALGLSGATFYNSYYNSYIDEYHSSLGLASSSMNFAYCTYNARTAMEALGGTEYYVAHEENPTLVPPSFDVQVAQGDVNGAPYAVYATDDVVPLAYTVSESMDRTSYDELDMVERQEALVQTVVLENGSPDDASVVSHAEALPYRIAYEVPEGSTLDVSNSSALADDGEIYVDGSEFGSTGTAVPETMVAEEKEPSVVLADASITVRKPNTVLYLDADLPTQAESYLCINGLEYKWMSSRDRFTEEEWAAMPFVRRLKHDLEHWRDSAPRETFLYVYGDGSRQEIWQMNGLHHLYGGKDDWCVNLGYSDIPRKGVAIEFVNPGVYSFSSMDLVAEDSGAVIADIDALAGAAATSIDYQGNRLACSVEGVHEGDFLAVRVPYSAGWSAQVNGEPVDIVRSNVGFMAIELPQSGRADIVLTFETPHVRVGALLTGVGIAATAVVCLMARRRRRDASTA